MYSNEIILAGAILFALSILLEKRGFRIPTSDEIREDVSRLMRERKLNQKEAEEKSPIQQKAVKIRKIYHWLTFLGALLMAIGVYLKAKTGG
jgi:hypothetical protein